MPICNPNEEEGRGGRRPTVRAGQKVLWAAGTEWGESRAGNIKVNVRFVCVDDPEGGTDVGGFVWDTFTLTDKAMWRLGQFARAAGVTEPWESENQEETDNVLTACPILVDCQTELYEGTEKLRCKSFSRWGGDVTEEMEKTIAAAEDWHNEGLAKRENQNNTDIPF